MVPAIQPTFSGLMRLPSATLRVFRRYPAVVQHFNQLFKGDIEAAHNGGGLQIHLSDLFLQRHLGDNDIVHIRNTITQDNEGKRTEGERTKSKTSCRDLALNQALKSYLQKWHDRQVYYQGLLKSEYNDAGHEVVHVCTYEDGRPLIPVVLSRRFTLLLQRANLPTIRFHDLRHTDGSLLVANGMSPRSVMEFLGHSDIQTTMNIYAHQFDEQKREVANCLENVLFPALSQDE